MFEYKRVCQGDVLFKKVLAFRYKVYCEERGFEDPEAHPNGLEEDEFDKNAVHFAAILKETGEVVGTVRIILNSQQGFPIEKNFSLNIEQCTHHTTIGEISRLALSKEYCQQLREKIKDFREGQEIVEGLFKCIASESKALGLTHWYAVMARSLFVLLRRRKIVFPCVGPPQDFHGVRSPYFGEIPEVLAENRTFLDIYSGSLESQGA